MGAYLDNLDLTTDTDTCILQKYRPFTPYPPLLETAAFFESLSIERFVVWLPQEINLGLFPLQLIMFSKME